jgi:hypothetical protein
MDLIFVRAFSAPFCAEVRDGWRYGECYLYCDVAVILPSECLSPLFWLGVASRRCLLESTGKVHNGGQETRNSRHGSMYLLCGIKSSLVGSGTFWGGDIFECLDCTPRGTSSIVQCRSVFGPTITFSAFRAAEVESCEPLFLTVKDCLCLYRPRSSPQKSSG